MSHPMKPYQVRCFVDPAERELRVVIGTYTEVFKEVHTTADVARQRADKFQERLRALDWR
jgi:hypothetical protein